MARTIHCLPRHLIVISLAMACALPLTAASQQEPAGRGGQRRQAVQRPQRDGEAPTGTGVLAGRVLADDTGRPVKRARVTITGGGTRARATTSDELGRYQVAGLPAGTYIITVAKAGYVDSMFGQRRALRAGTPVELADGQSLGNLDVRLPRGGVITGRVLDEDGEPLARAMVTVLRYQYQRGEKRLTAAGGDQSDDRGQYRVFGLPPGDYFVSATTNDGLQRVVGAMLAGPGGRGGGRGAGAPTAVAPSEDDTPPVGYAPTYYPGVTTVADASRVKLTVAQEMSGIDFQLQLTPLATVRGTVSGLSGVPVTLVPEDGLAGPRGGGPYRAMVADDGSFTIPNVPPGRYTAIARGDGFMGLGDLRAAFQQFAVSGEEVFVALTAAAGTRLSGTITLESAATPVPEGFGQFRVNPQPLDAALLTGRVARPADVGEKGVFTIPSVLPGRYVMRANGPRGWMLKSVFLDGRDITDEAVEIKGDTIDGFNIIFSDRIATVSGTVRDARGGAVGGMTAIIFPSDPAAWLPQSRRIQAARSDQNGAYRLTPLPDGEYLLAVVDDVDQGEWFDPSYLSQLQEHAIRLQLGEGEQRAQELKVR